MARPQTPLWDFGEAQLSELTVTFDGEDWFFSDAMRRYLRVIGLDKAASLGLQLSCGDGLRGRVAVKVECVSAKEANSLVEQWPDDPCFLRGSSGYFPTTHPACSDFPHRP
jgi:hypothetical protein